MNNRAWRHAAAAIAAALLAHAPHPAVCQRLGLHFDKQADTCEAPIETGFGTAHAYVFAHVQVDSAIGGVAFKIVLPGAIRIIEGSVMFPRDIIGESNGTLVDGVDLRFRQCMSGPEPVKVAEFEIEDTTLGGPPRPDLRLELQGAGLDSIQALEPIFRSCDPQDPLGEGRGMYTALGVDATLNCTMRCGCTTALAPRRWGAVKSRFR